MSIPGLGEIADRLRRSTVLVRPGGSKGNGSGVLWSSVRLAPGNSGGPLADASGRVIGINAMAAGRLALAIASNEVTRFLRGESGAESLRLGVSVMPARLPRSIGGRRFALVVAAVEPGTPGARASLLPGDILLGTEEKRFTSVRDLAEALQCDAEYLLRLEFLRGDYERVRRVSVQLVARGQKVGAMAA